MDDKTGVIVLKPSTRSNSSYTLRFQAETVEIVSSEGHESFLDEPIEFHKQVLDFINQ